MTPNGPADARVADSVSHELPGLAALAWMLFMQPILLHERLGKSGIDHANGSGWKLWRTQGPTQRVARQYCTGMLTVLCVAMPLLAFVTAGTCDLTGLPIAIGYPDVARGVGLGIGVGVTLGLVYGVASGVAFGVPFGVTLGLACGVKTVGVASGVIIVFPDDLMPAALAFVMAGSVERGVTYGLRWGIAGDSYVCVAHTVILALAVGVWLGVMTGPPLACQMVHPEDPNPTPPVSFIVEVSIVQGMIFGGGAAVLVLAFGILRVPLAIIETMLSLVLSRVEQRSRYRMLRMTPVLFHDLSYIPYVGLLSHIVMASRYNTNIATVRRVLDACERSPGQRHTGRVALAILQAHELSWLGASRRFQQAADLEGEWLPGNTGGASPLFAYAEVARYLLAAQLARVPRNRSQHIQRASDTLRALRNQRPPEIQAAREFRTTLETWERVVEELRQEARAASADVLPNPFRAGDPLQPDIGGETFRGRKEIVRQIELLIAAGERSASVALLGPRRSGKSSLLKMLPTMLPDTLCVFFDLQDNPLRKPLDLFSALARRAAEQARQQRRTEIPIPNGNSLQAAREWLDRLEQRASRERILLCLDEFETLEDLFDRQPGTRHELLQLMGLLRATIQHRRHVTLLVSGVTPFDELSELWNDYFISTRELRLGPLEDDLALDLLRQPIPASEGFPEDAVAEDVARAIVARTGGQPYLVQLYGFWLIEHLNTTSDKRRRARVSDLEAVDQTVFEQAAPYFRACLRPRGAPFDVESLIEQFAKAEGPDLTPRQRHWLVHRGLLAEDGRLAFPILGRWLMEYGD